MINLVIYSGQLKWIILQQFTVALRILLFIFVLVMIKVKEILVTNLLFNHSVHSC